MKIILLKDVKKVGKKDDIIEVSDGFANNYLLKNKMAVQFTKESVSHLEKEKTIRELKEEKTVEDMKKLKETIEKKHIIFKVNVGKDERVFGQISSKQIKERLAEEGIEIEKNVINVLQPIDTLGIHNVKINLHKNIIAKLQIVVEKK